MYINNFSDKKKCMFNVCLASFQCTPRNQLTCYNILSALVASQGKPQHSPNPELHSGSFPESEQLWCYSKSVYSDPNKLKNIGVSGL